jgi:hypothetical protein
MSSPGWAARGGFDDGALWFVDSAVNKKAALSIYRLASVFFMHHATGHPWMPIDRSEIDGKLASQPHHFLAAVAHGPHFARR